MGHLMIRFLKNLIKNYREEIPSPLYIIAAAVWSLSEPFLPKLVRDTPSSRKLSAEYYYSLWLQHLNKIHNSGFQFPSTIAELGPGHSIGVGLSALLSGARRYFALDVVKHFDEKKEIEILRELIKLFRERPKGKELDFPHEILKDDLNTNIKNTRISAIEDAILNGETREVKIKQFIPWNSPEVIKENSVDMIISSFVLEHVEDLESTYKSMHRWLRNGGIMSNIIDFGSHGTSKEWNGHWGYSDAIWKLIRGNRKYLINRKPLTSHLKLLHKFNFDIIEVDIEKEESGIGRKQLSSRFKGMTNIDLKSKSAQIIAKKR
ncbi:hypothetical protein AKJ52_00125 [candidate division MSBL1 archaeon SCGC-AAA382C18]|uniref:Methyltransferase type 11 domain-containing protein n=1 Tax=candidate division MSBL1 archaeon SCGC-AAA382C18 TaxID=1698281 RepID=A0A133VM28_9EURY|nr:hypothetical protein AKJ52_00125 [candidate division MSBL1 archaeon SCGC-AAA382C18]